MKKLYVDLDDTFKDTERYFRKILSSGGFDIPDSLETVYTLVRYSILRRNDELSSLTGSLLNQLNEVYGGRLNAFCDDVYNEFVKVVMSYPFIPNRNGVSDCFDLIKSEYDVVFFSAYSFKEEKLIKETFANALEVGHLIVPFCEKSGIVLEKGSVVVDNDLDILQSLKGAEKKIVMYSEYSKPRSLKGYDHLVIDWYGLCDYLMECDTESEFRTDIYAGIPLSNRFKNGA